MEYRPQAIDTSGIDLGPELRKLLELLAESSHDTWALRKLADGWTHGPSHDNLKRKHPCLVPYAQLSEVDKDYDRDIVREAIKAILKLGYKIEPPTTFNDTENSNQAKQILESIHRAANDADTSALFRVWGGRELRQWAKNPDTYRTMARLALSRGAPLLAYDVCMEALRLWSDDLFLRQQKAVALAVAGGTQTAHTILQTVIAEHYSDTREVDDKKELEETIGSFARTYKDLWRKSSVFTERATYLQQAIHWYKRGYQLTNRYWTGINVATLTLLSGHEDEARRVAKKVYAQCLILFNALERSAASKEDVYWLLATLGEAQLILRECDQAYKWYEQAAKAHPRQWRDHSTARAQAIQILDHYAMPHDPIEEILRPPTVVVFAGHMIDRPGRHSPRFPPSLEPVIAKAIRELMDKIGAEIGFASAKCGADILFHESMLNRGGEISVILPYDAEQFIRDNVDITENPSWTERFRKVLGAAARTYTVSDQRLALGSVSYDYAHMILYGLALNRARILGSEVHPVAVYDGGAPDGECDMHSIVTLWTNKYRKTVDIIDPRSHFPSPASYPSRLHPSEDIPKWTRPIEIKALLFADTVQFRAFTDDQVISFASCFLESVSQIIQLHRPRFVETAGDGIYAVFDTVGEAGKFALRLAELAEKTNWAEHGLPNNLAIRVALHVGPVHRSRNPLTGVECYNGTHVTRTARIEPVTPPGQVYASEEFAAVALADEVQDFDFEYVGLTVLAKQHGTKPLFRVRMR